MKGLQFILGALSIAVGIFSGVGLIGAISMIDQAVAPRAEAIPVSSVVPVCLAWAAMSVLTLANGLFHMTAEVKE